MQVMLRACDAGREKIYLLYATMTGKLKQE